MATNLERMIQLADEVFASRRDPNQLDVDEEVLIHLKKIHPSTVSEFDDGSGPIAWLLLIPTTHALMQQFLQQTISEYELYRQTPLNVSYDSLYLCSAIVLPEHRRKGIIKNLTLKAVEAIQHDHPIQSLFVWTFSKEGLLGSQALARALSLPLYQRTAS